MNARPNRRARRRAAALDRKAERVRSRHNALFETYLRHLPELPEGEPFERGRIYHVAVCHSHDCRFYMTQNFRDCDCSPEVRRFLEPERS